MLKALKNYRNAGWFLNHLFAYQTLAKRRWNIKHNKPFLYNCELFLDTHCNLRCEHCSISLFQYQDGFPRAMSLEQIAHIGDQLKALDCFSICLVGGELTLRKDLPEIIQIFYKRKILPTMITNGWVVDDAYVKKLKKAGIFSIGVSLNGASAEQHDTFGRREGSYERALRAIEAVRANGVRCSICVVPTHQSVKNGEYKKLIDFAVSKGIRVNVNYPALCGQYTDHAEELLTEEELKEVREYFKLTNVTSDFTVMADRYECPAGRKKIYVLPDGSVCPCTFIHISFGNILKEPLLDIMKRMWSVPLLMSRPDRCLVGEDHAFNKEWLDPVFKSPTVPLPWTEHPLINAGAVQNPEAAQEAGAACGGNKGSCGGCC